MKFLDKETNKGQGRMRRKEGRDQLHLGVSWGGSKVPEVRRDSVEEVT